MFKMILTDLLTWAELQSAHVINHVKDIAHNVEDKRYLKPCSFYSHKLVEGTISDQVVVDLVFTFLIAFVDNSIFRNVRNLIFEL